jgi:hypothetical protein
VIRFHEWIPATEAIKPQLGNQERILHELDELLKQIGQKYSVEAVPLRLGGKELKILQLTDSARVSMLQPFSRS